MIKKKGGIFMTEKRKELVGMIKQLSEDKRRYNGFCLNNQDDISTDVFIALINNKNLVNEADINAIYDYFLSLYPMIENLLTGKFG